MDREGPLAVVYSDAAFSPGQPMTYGWVLCLAGQQPRSASGTVPDDLLRQFKERRSQIMVGEIIAAFSAIYSCRAALAGCKILHLIDNQGALSALVGGFGSDDDVSSIACLYQILIIQLGARVWMEFVESESNMADGPSRSIAEWLSSSEFAAIGCTIEASSLPSIDFLSAAPFKELNAFVQARRVAAHSVG